MDEQAMRREVLVAFEYSYEHDDWVYPLADALWGVTAAEAESFACGETRLRPSRR